MEKAKLSLFSMSIESLEQKLEKQKAILADAKQFWEHSNIPDAYEAAFKLVDEMEKATLLARVLPAHTGHPQALKHLNAQFVEQVPMRMGFTPEGWFCLIIPALLPKKKARASAYLRDMLYPGVANFFRGKPPVRYTNCDLIFRHVYNKDRPEREYRDHDNVEVSAVANIISHFLLHDDDAMRCRHHYLSAPGDEDCTEVYIVPQSEFIDWLVGEKNLQSKGVILHEYLP